MLVPFENQKIARMWIIDNAWGRWAGTLYRYRDAIALLLLPELILAVNPNWPFQDIGSWDPWYYFGGFLHFARYQKLIVNYPAERLMWILPGAILVRILSPVYGLLAVHVLFYSISVFSMYFLVKTFADRRTALLTAFLLGCHPLFLGANGWAYVDSASITYFLLTLAFIVKAKSSRFPWAFLILAGASCASLVFTYILWLSVSPCFVYFYYVTSYGDAVVSFKAFRDRLPRFLVLFLVGAAGLTACLQIIHAAIYGFGKGFFFQNNWATALAIIAQKHSPFSSGNFQWVWSASWIVFPVLVLFVSVGLSIQDRRGVITLASQARAAIHIYLYVLAVAVIMTARPVRLLEFDYFASILIPPAFLAMGMTIFRVPTSWGNARFYSLLAVCCIVCVLPLSRPNLYLSARIDGLSFTYALGVVMMAICIVHPRKNSSWVALMCLFPIVSFALVPTQPGAAWLMQYNGMALTRRVALAVGAIDRRLPLDAYPAFWIDNYDSPNSAEYRAIMCAILSHGFSMQHYPEVDAGLAYRPGTFLILITENKDVFDTASEKMTSAGMPLSLYGQDRISGGGTSYWLTYVRVLESVSRARVDSIAP